MSILAVELTPKTTFGFVGGPEFSTRISTLRNSHERRNANWAQARHRWTAPFQNITDTEARDILRVFNACHGMTFGFLFKDFLDFQATVEPLGNAPSGSAPVQLIKTSTAGSQSYVRTITKPVASGFTLYQTAIAKTGTLDTTTGLFTPTTAWTAGQPLTWTGEFRVPVRFAADWLPFSIDNKRGTVDFAVNGSVDVIEVFGE
jgi:uncharacterized protein (TIGR02217 family)